MSTLYDECGVLRKIAYLFFTKKEVKVANSHYSLKSSEDAGPLFKRMFPDSRIAKEFTCGETKCAYVLVHGLAPYFKRLTLTNVSKQRAYVMLFDESLNKFLQSKQMDLHVRMWSGAEVRTTYIGSEFLGHSAAVDIVAKMSDALSELGLKNLIQSYSPNID